MSYDPNTPSNPSYPPPPQNYGDGTSGGNPPYGQPGYGNQPAYGSAPGYGNAPAYGGGPGDYPGGQVKPGNGLAIAGFICALVGLLIFNIILGPLGLIFGIIGLQRANRGAKFKGLALAAIIIGAIDILLFIVAIAFLSSNGFTY